MEIDKKNNQEERETPKIVRIILVLFFSLIIVSLAGGFYYFALRSSYFDTTIQQTVVINKALPKKVLSEPVFITKVIKYSFPADISGIKSVDGFCGKASISEPFRNDTFICTDLIKNYDPCFVSLAKDKAVCQMNPLLPDIFIINLTKPLKETILPNPIKDNWAWFLELEDGTICSPYTSASPIINEEKANYGCKSKVKGDLTVLTGDLVKGQTWTAKMMVVVKDNIGTGWNTKSSEVVKLKTVWQ